MGSTHPRPYTLKSLATLLVGIAATAMFMIGLAGTANAAGSYIYTQPGKPQAYAYCTAGGCTPGDFAVPNGTPVAMVCYKDASSSNPNGNYPTNRYFDVTFSGRAGIYVIQSSYVYNQTTVGRCGPGY